MIKATVKGDARVGERTLVVSAVVGALLGGAIAIWVLAL